MQKLPANALIHEESPYLQQHAHNPVHWMPWGKEAFARAKREKKPIFLSIGYSTCHWCHVMEEESFEDPEVAKVLNRYFIAIKVDREEHPQIDRYYQRVHALVTRRAGGWPLTILLTPDRKPFFAATYLPKEERYNQPGLLDLLRSAAKVWQEKPSEIRQIAAEVDRALKRSSGSPTPTSVGIDIHLREAFVQSLKWGYDEKFGGWGSEPKFPRAMTLTALLKIYELTGDRDALSMADKTLEAMALGGIYDQIEGGFYRYSTDREWKIPHFEKMLYTNAELLEAYAEAARLTARPLYRRIVEETVALFERRYRDPDSGLYYGASDADSLDPDSGEKIEGYYYTYRYNRVLAAAKKAGISHPEKALEALGITKNGNFIRFRSNPYLSDLQSPDAALKKLLGDLRDSRPYPFIDRKILTAWNALWIHGLFVAASLEKAYEKMALQALESLYKHLYVDGRLYHQKLPGRSPKVPALLEDYSFLIAATLDAYDASGETRWLQRAKRLTAQVQKLFKVGDRWYDSEGSFRNALDLEGGSYRSPLAVLADDYLRLALYAEDPRYRESAREILRANARILESYPQAAPAGLLAWLADRGGYVLVKIPSRHFAGVRRRIKQSIRYPFVLFRKSADPLYQACRIDRCFLYDRNETKFV
ncbi:thioredoxin domain-containing protein, partial [Nitratifractor sp.]